jgi:glycosyltransferase involved in cell wall biosynthesis
MTRPLPNGRDVERGPDRVPPPRISIVVAVRNAASTLAECLDSIRAQTYSDKELIVIDGGSTDGTVELLRQRESTIDYWISEPDRGIYHAWNKGLAQATGDWICFLGADDYFWSPAALASLAQPLQTLDPATARVVYGRVAVVNAGKEELYVVGEDWRHAGRHFRQVMSIPHPGLLHHRSLFEQLGPFDESYRISGDYELLLRELKDAPALFAEDSGIVVAMRAGGISSRPELSLLQLREVRRAQICHGFPLPGSRWIMAMARVCLRFLLWHALGENHARILLDAGRRLQGKPLFWTRT